MLRVEQFSFLHRMNTERRRRLFEDPVSLSFSFSSESSIEISRRIIPFISQLGPLIVNREENVARREREEGRSSKLWRTAENGRGNHLLQFKALSRVAFFLLDSYVLFISSSPSCYPLIVSSLLPTHRTLTNFVEIRREEIFENHLSPSRGKSFGR